MVSFICNACGQTVKKAQVEKHYQNDCRICDVLSCIDCGKDFHGDEYVGHTSCITEAEKYQGKLYKPKDKQNKGEHKQQEWLKQVREATRSGAVDPWLTGLLDRISEYSNIPRKKAKFQNFCRNSINVRDSTTLDKLWEIFSASAKSPHQDETNSNGTHENGKSNLLSSHEDKLHEKDECSEKTQDRQKDKELLHKSKEKENKKTRDSKKYMKDKKNKGNDKHETEQKSKGNKSKNDMNGNTEDVDGLKDTKKQKKKRRREDEQDEPCTQAKVLKVENGENSEQQNHFKWKSVIKAVLRQAPDQELPIKRLRKKVLAEFQAQGANVKDLTDNELQALFEKKVTNNPKFKVKKDRVRLVK